MPSDDCALRDAASQKIPKLTVKVVFDLFISRYFSFDLTVILSVSTD
jgi:hypothetical protein